MFRNPPVYLVRLMSRASLTRHTRVKPEEIICIGIADMLRIATIQGKLKAVWSHVPNEGKRSLFVAMVMKAIGMVPGTPDYFFAWPEGSGLIEVKSGKGRLTENQMDYRQWCADLGINHSVCRSVQEVVDQLVQWRVLDVA